MKNISILFLLLSIVDRLSAATILNEDTENAIMQAGTWTLSIAGASMLVWLITRFFYSGSKASKGKAS